MDVHPQYQDIFVKSLQGHELQGCETLSQSIERTTMRTLTMETSLVDNLEKCHQQDQSPLYNKLPKEIRDQIFEFAASQYEDLQQPYKINAFHYRPGYRGPLKTSTGLLRTCRRVWLETNALAMLQAKKTFWFEGARGPPNQLKYDFASDWTSLNKKNFETLHLFTQKHMAERMFGRSDSISAIIYDLRPKTIRVTWRHTDWNRWEDPLPLELKEDWIQRALNSPLMQGIQRFELELETLTKNKDQLDPIVERISNLEGSRIQSESEPGRATQLKLVDKPEVWHWTGPPDINDHIDDAHRGMAKLDYHVVVLTWKAVPAGTLEDGQPGVNPSKMDYLAHLQFMRLRRGPPPPRMITHTVRLHLLQGGWQKRQFPFGNYIVRKNEMENAERMEQVRRMQFLKAFANIEARRLAEDWKGKDSLLKFEE